MTQREGGHAKTGAETGVIRPQARERLGHRELEEARKDPSLILKGCSPSPHGLVLAWGAHSREETPTWDRGGHFVGLRRTVKHRPTGDLHALRAGSGSVLPPHSDGAPFHRTAVTHGEHSG